MKCLYSRKSYYGFAITDMMNKDLLIYNNIFFGISMLNEYIISLNETES